MSIAAICGKTYITDHSILLLLNSLSKYLAEDDFVSFSEKIERDYLQVNLLIYHPLIKLTEDKYLLS